MRIGLIGCGFVADSYARTLDLHPELELVGVCDRDPERGRRFAARHSVQSYGTLSDLLDDASVSLVLNLTSPGSHFEVSRACLEAGVHVYSEKPLALEAKRAEELVVLAEQRGLRIACAPCSLLGEAAQTVWKALREERVGRVRVVYAEMDDGLLHRMNYRRWLSDSGVPWPYRSEFETGCTLEHAAYQVSWLVAFFGPARSVSAFASEQIPDKLSEPSSGGGAPDFSVACIRFASDVVARLTCSILAPRDHRLRIIGDAGVLTVRDTWHYRSPVLLQRWLSIRRRTLLLPWGRPIRLLGRENPRIPRRGSSQMDYLRGVAELAEAVRKQRPSRLSERFCLHVNDVVLAIHDATGLGTRCEITSTFDAIEPMPWAR